VARSPNGETNALLTVNSDGVLEYTSEGRGLWRIAVKDLVLMAEYTTNEGPWLDDYFFVFVATDTGTVRFATASYYARGCEEVLGFLALRYGAKIEPGLVNSTDWKSRVIWPADLAGQEYFDRREVEPATLFAKLRKMTFGPMFEYFPSHAVRDYLRSRLA
jgi:hypothetical protein